MALAELCGSDLRRCGSFGWYRFNICLFVQGAEINAEHPEGVNALMYGAAGAHLGVVQVRGSILSILV